jgi:hypothetical protein
MAQESPSGNGTQDTIQAPAHPCLLRTIHNSQVMETAKMPSTDEWIKKMWYLHNGVLLSHKKEIVSFMGK